MVSSLAGIVQLVIFCWVVILLAPLGVVKALSSVRDLVVGSAGRTPAVVGPVRFAFEVSTQLAIAEPSLRLGVDVEIADSPGRGKGLFALRNIDEDVFVAPYLGPIKKWSDVEDDVDNSYLFELDEDTCIDGSDPTLSNWARYLNHSKRRKNCHAEQIEGPWGRVTGISFRTLRPILAGEELFFDYGDDYWEKEAPNPLTRFKIHYG